MFLVWFYKNPTETFWYSKLLAVFTLLESRAGHEWLDYIVTAKPHVPLGLCMNVQTVNAAINIHMIKNTRWLKFIEEGRDIPYNESLALAESICKLPLVAIGLAITGSNN